MNHDEWVKNREELGKQEVILETLLIQRQRLSELLPSNFDLLTDLIATYNNTINVHRPLVERLRKEGSY